MSAEAAGPDRAFQHALDVVILAGVPVRDELVNELVGLLDDDEPLQRKLRGGVERATPIVPLTVQERVALIGVLGEHPSSGLRPLRDALLSEFKRGEAQRRANGAGNSETSRYEA